MRTLLAATLAVVSTSLSAQAPNPAKPMPAEVFAQLPFLEGPQLSPDGTKVAARMAVNGTQILIIFPLGETAKSVKIGLGDNDLNWWSWVNDDWLVAGVGRAADVEGDKWYIRRAVSIGAAGQGVKTLGAREAAQGADDILWMANDGTPRILLAMQKSIYPSDINFWPQVYEVDVSTGKMKQVVRP